MPESRFTPEVIGDMFRHHPPDEQQQKQHAAIRSAAIDFALVLAKNTPASADQTAAFRLLRECVYTANAAIATEGKY